MKIKKNFMVFLSFVIAVTGLLSTLVIAPGSVSAATTELYASPAGDGSECSEAFPCSLSGVQTKVRSMNSDMTGDIIVNLRGGSYNIVNTFTLDHSDSGSNGYMVRYQAYPGETPVFEGGQAVTGWTLHDETNHIYKANVGDRQFRQLYIEDQRAIRARTPNRTDEVTDGPYYTAINVDKDTFIVDASQITDWDHLNQVEVVWRGHWMQKIGHIQSYAVNGDQATITFPANEASGFVDRSYTDMDTTWFHFENAYEFLDAEGEWYLDTSEQTLYYKPRAGEDMSSVSVITPVTESLVNITGTLSEPVHHVAFKDIVFQHSNWIKPSIYGLVDGQAMVQLQTEGNAVIPGAVNVSNASHLLFEGNTFRRTGAHGLHFRGMSNYNTAIGNTFSDVSAGGLYSFTSDNRYGRYDTFSYNTVENFGRYYTGAVGIYASRPEHMVIDHNTVRYGRYTGISLGWSWDDSETGTNYNRISHNLIHNVMELHSDGGGIYSLGRQKNGLRYKNYIYGLTRSPYTSDYPIAGIYLDNGSTGVTVESNLLDDTVDAFYARNTPIYDNLFRNNYYNVNRGFINGADGNPGRSFVPVSFMYGDNDVETEFVTGQVLGTPRNDVSVLVGMKFTTGSAPVTVKQLGRWVIAGNTEVHTVKIVNTNGQDVASVEVPTAGESVGFKYVPLDEAIVLPANTSYYLVSSETGGGDQFYNEDTTITTTNVATADKQFYSFGVSDYFGNTLVNNTYVSDLWPAEADAIRNSAGADAHPHVLWSDPEEPVSEYEAEAGEWEGESTESKAASGASGGLAVGSIDNVGDYTRINDVNGGRGGIASLVVTFANGSAEHKSLSLYVNGAKTQQAVFQPTGGWNTFQDTVAIPIILDAGEGNTIRLQRDASDNASVDIDKLTVTLVTETEEEGPAPTPTPTPTLEPGSEPEPGDVYEAEAAALDGGVSVNNNHPGYSGTGFVDQLNVLGGSVTFTVNIETAGTKDVSLRYANGDDTSSLSVYVNGVKIRQTMLPGFGNWDAWGYVTEALELQEGENTITYKYDTGDLARVNLDYISIAFDPEPTPEPTPGPATPTPTPTSGQGQLDTDGQGNKVWTFKTNESELLRKLSEESDSLLIHATSTEKVDKVVVELSEAVIAEAAKLGKPILIESGGVRFKLEPGTLGAQETGDVRIGWTIAQGQSLPDHFKPVSNILDFELSAGGVREFGKPIGVSFTIDPSVVRNLKKLGIYYYDELLDRWEYVGGKLNDDGTIGVKLQHFSRYAVLESELTFDDIQGHWAQEVIEELAAKQIVFGLSDNHYMPDGKLTRAQFVSLIVRALKLPKATEILSIADVPEDAWYKDDVYAALQANIAFGRSETLFAPNGEISREEMAVILMRAYRYAIGQSVPIAEESQTASFSDEANISVWAAEAVSEAANLSLIKGFEDGSFSPSASGTRAQAAELLSRLLDSTNR